MDANPQPAIRHTQSNAPQSDRHVTFERERGVYDLRITPDVAHIVVKVGRDDGRTDRVERVFHTLAEENVPLFLIKLHHSAVSFAVAGKQVAHVEKCMRGVAFDCLVRPNLVLISIVASSMRDLTGVMVRIADALQEAGARLYGTGDSHNSVQCLIDGSRADAAVEQLRLAFGLEEHGA